jgi:ATP-dependent DNA ligase
LGWCSRILKERPHWSKRYRPVIGAVEKLPAKSFIIDGEMIAPDRDGRPNFHEMHSRMAWNTELLAFVTFDILHLDGRELRSLPAVQRKDILWELVRPATDIIQYSHRVEGGGAEFYAAADKMDSRAWSRSGRTALIAAGRPKPR